MQQTRESGVRNRMELYGIFIAAIKKLTVTSAAAFVMASAVAGLFAGIADTVLYFRYSRGFPGTDFTMNIVAGIAAFLMLAFSVRTAVGLHRHNTKIVLRFMIAATAAAFLMAFLPRPPIGSAVRLDLFTYLGGLGTLATILFGLSVPSPDAPDNTPPSENSTSYHVPCQGITVTFCSLFQAPIASATIRVYCFLR